MSARKPVMESDGKRMDVSRDGGLRFDEAGFSDQDPGGETDDESTGQGGLLQVKGVKDGPLLITGNFSVIADGGRTRWQGKRVALCRCGESENKPFCDGTHKVVGFKSE